MDCSRPGFPVLHHLPEFAQVYVHCICYCFINKFFIPFFKISHLRDISYDICFSLSDLFHLVWQSLGSSTNIANYNLRMLLVVYNISRRFCMKKGQLSLFLFLLLFIYLFFVVVVVAFSFWVRGSTMESSFIIVPIKLCLNHLIWKLECPKEKTLNQPAFLATVKL